MIFKEGDIVIRIKITADRYPDSVERPLWGGEYGKIKGVVTYIYSDGDTKVRWENGAETHQETRDLILFSELEDNNSHKDLELKIDLDILDKVVLPIEVKEEILSVLKQHNNSKKLFEEWGLGDMMEYGRGMTFLFYGGPGTGKTWTAKLMAQSLKKELLVISAAEIQSSEPGGANRNIVDAFANAKSSKKVLLIDECDSLITARNDVGMIIGSEINTLLTEIEKFEGVCILTTNRADTLDEALERRISLIIEFPNPTYEQRLEIWKKLLPDKMPLDNDVDINKLAEYSLTGGQIKNVILNSARFAISQEKESVPFEYFITSINRINKSKSLLGSRSRYSQVIHNDFIREKSRQEDIVSQSKIRSSDKIASSKKEKTPSK